MEQLVNHIPLCFSDQRVNAMLGSGRRGGITYGIHFTQSEELFLRLSEVFSVPSITIHHDIRSPRPEDPYLEALKRVLESLVAHLPDVFDGLTYFFDPSEIFKPCFFRLYTFREITYLYLLRLDLSFRPSIHETIVPGTNDRSPEYRTDRLYIESDFIPLERVIVEDERILGFEIRQTLSSTWIGENGRGYNAQGQWIDHELTKYLTKLFAPQEKRLYPFYPFTCKYRTVCLSLLSLSQDGRKRYLPYLHLALDFLTPNFAEVEQELKTAQEFSESLPAFSRLKGEVPSEIEAVWNAFSVNVYLNAHRQKEFSIAVPS